MHDQVPWRYQCNTHNWGAARQPCPYGDGTDTNPPVPSGRQAVEEIIRAATCGTDFGGWLAHVLAQAAARVGSVDALMSSRPGSWEASDIEQLLRGTVGWNDEHLADYLPGEPPVHADGWEYGVRFTPGDTMEAALDDRAQAQAHLELMRGAHPDWDPRLVRRPPAQPPGDWQEVPPGEDDHGGNGNVRGKS